MVSIITVFLLLPRLHIQQHSRPNLHKQLVTAPRITNILGSLVCHYHCHLTCHWTYYHIVVFSLSDCCTTNVTYVLNMSHSHSCTWAAIWSHNHIVTCHRHITCHCTYCHIVVSPLSHCCTTNFTYVLNMSHSHSYPWAAIWPSYHTVTCHSHITCHCMSCHIAVSSLSDCCTIRSIDHITNRQVGCVCVCLKTCFQFYFPMDLLIA